MLDMKFVRENPDLVRSYLNKRRVEFPLDELLELDVKRRKLIAELQDLRHRRNVCSEQVASMKAKKHDASKIITEMKDVSARISSGSQELNKTEEALHHLQLGLPNVVHEGVPDCIGDENSLEVRRWGKPFPMEFPVKDHIDLGSSLGIIDTERGAKVAGARFYYLLGDLVRLNFALLQFALEFGQKKGYTLVQPPFMLRREIMEGAVDLTSFEDSIYKLDGEDLYLLTTSEHALLAYHADEILRGDRLPIRYLGVSPCFRKEAGAHGRDTKGIFRVHEFEKVEQFVFTRPEDSWQEHERLISTAEEFFQQLGLPYRVVNICSGDLGAPAAKKYDLEVWLPGQGMYREAVSCSNCTDWQARRLSIRFRDKMGDEPRLVHTLNSTLVATGRALIAIMENNQRADGSFDVPKSLQSFIGGKENIRSLTA
ncbi:MAG: serine--tRNA ligase [Conexivisphaerales archaeon]|jgi:seryl-tRNA synthetase